MTNDGLRIDMEDRDCSLCAGTISAQVQEIHGKSQSAQIVQRLQF
jgi:hypothetical protein